MSAIVEVWRGPRVESRHELSVAVVDATGRLRASAGDPGLVAFARSAVKPFQAMALVEDGAADRYGLEPAELALACGSHSAEARHVEAARAILRRAQAREEMLVCGPHAPMSSAAARTLMARGVAPSRIHNNCSGKHAGMMLLAHAHGWPLAGYERPDHPVQQRVLREMERWTDVAGDEIETAIDGCGLPTFALPLTAMAGAFARLARAARRGERGPARIVAAMVDYPEYVAGTGRMCTGLMRAAAGRIFCKVGAEGVYCAGIPGAELGIALKVHDGAIRASEPALLAVLAALNLLSEEELGTLEAYARPVVRNTRGDAVGAIRARIELEPAA
jgi:L-asparaginase II